MKKSFPFLLLLLLACTAAFVAWSPVPPSLQLEPQTQIRSETRQIASAPVPPPAPTEEAKFSPITPVTKPAPRSHAPEFSPLSLREIEAARSEMKVTLAALYGAQKSFYSEHKRYSTDLSRGVGYAPEGKERWSKAGFLSPFLPTKLVGEEEPRFMSIDEFVAEGGLKFERSGMNFSLQDLGRFCSRGCTANEEQFEIIAAAVLVEGYEPDVWVINEKKELVHAHDGTQGSNSSR